jgi:hypothetical protein
VSLNSDDPDSADVVNRLSFGGRVRAMPVGEFAPDPFEFFTAATEVVAEWTAPDWVAYIDTDEFWVPRLGHLSSIRIPARANVVHVQSFNAAPIRHGGTILTTVPPDPETPLINVRYPNDPQFFVDHPDARLIQADAWGTKVLARTEIVRRVERGAHKVVASSANAVRVRAQDLLIVHYPFTSAARFQRKISAVRRRLAEYGDRYNGTEAWHWRRWLELDDLGMIDAEFERQVFREDQVAYLLSIRFFVRPEQAFDLLWHGWK